MNSYFNERDDKNIKKLREICETFPSFAIEFFVGIQLRTSPLTRLNYAMDLRIFFTYLANEIFKNEKISMKELTMSHINRIKAYDLELFLNYISSYDIGDKHYRCGDRAKQRKLAVLKSFFKYYFKNEKIDCNVAERVDMPKIHDKPIIRLEVNEVVDLLDTVESDKIIGLSKREQSYHSRFKERDIALLTLLLGSGIRVSECVGLNIDDIDFPNASFIITRKGGNKTILYFADEIGTALKKYLSWLDLQKKEPTKFGNKIKDKNALFISAKGQRMTPRAVEMLVKKYSNIVTPLKKITPHKLRSTYGTELYRQTQDIYVVADVLGHKDINTTKKHYAAMSDDIKRNAAKAVKLRDNDDK